MNKISITFEELRTALSYSFPIPSPAAVWRELLKTQPEELEDGCHYMSSTRVVYQYIASRGSASHYWLAIGKTANISFDLPYRPMRKLIPVEEEE